MTALATAVVAQFLKYSWVALRTISYAAPRGGNSPEGSPRLRGRWCR